MRNGTPIGMKIVDVRAMTAAENRALYGDEQLIHPSLALVLEDGSILTAQCDEEGNGPGAIGTLDKDGTSGLLVMREAPRRRAVAS